MANWDHYADFDEAKNHIYSEMMPSGIKDEFAEALYSAGEYKAWAIYMDNEHDWYIDMGEFWADFRDAYAALG